MKRRELLGAVPAVAALSIDRIASASAATAAMGRLKQGVTRMNFDQALSLEACCRIAARLGVKGFDFIGDPADWPTMRKYGLTVSMYRVDYGGGVSAPGPGPPGPQGWHAIGGREAKIEYLPAIHRAIDLAATHGIPNILLLAGTRESVSYGEGMSYAVAFCNAVKSHAEAKGVTLCMELLNSKGIDGPPLSLFDRTSWGVEVVKQVNSPRVKLLYDIFHAQIMEGDVVSTLRENIDSIAHVHLGGVPGRHELDDRQELNYRFIARALVDLKFTGFVTHEWSPSAGADPVEALRRSIGVMNG